MLGVLAPSLDFDLITTNHVLGNAVRVKWYLKCYFILTFVNQTTMELGTGRLR